MLNALKPLLGLLGLMVCLTSSMAWASEWVEVSRNGNGDIIYIDKESVVPHVSGGGVYQAWNKNVYRNIQQIKNAIYFCDQRKVGFTQALKLYDCSGRRSALMQTIKYDSSGHQLDNDKSAKPDWQPVVPDSVSDVMWRFVCGAKH